MKCVNYVMSWHPNSTQLFVADPRGDDHRGGRAKAGTQQRAASVGPYRCFGERKRQGGAPLAALVSLCGRIHSWGNVCQHFARGDDGGSHQRRD
jgi:hypothetical protein